MPIVLFGASQIESCRRHWYVPEQIGNLLGSCPPYVGLPDADMVETGMSGILPAATAAARASFHACGTSSGFNLSPGTGKLLAHSKQIDSLVRLLGKWMLNVANTYEWSQRRQRSWRRTSRRGDRWHRASGSKAGARYLAIAVLRRDRGPGQQPLQMPQKETQGAWRRTSWLGQRKSKKSEKRGRDKRALQLAKGQRADVGLRASIHSTYKRESNLPSGVRKPSVTD